jgi:outer membrane lipoprotein SlyB
LLVAVAALSGCVVRQNSASVRPSGLPAPAPAAVRTRTVSAVIVSSEPVTIEPSQSGVGARDVLGSVGNARRAASTLGRVATSPTATRGEEITIRTEDGEIFTIVQERRSLPFEPGERVILIRRTSDDPSRNSAEVVRRGELIPGDY